MAEKCDYNAPFFAIKKQEGKYLVLQGNCHHWNCKRCGPIRAKHEYGRIVEGCRSITGNGHQLFFITITCRGKELSVEEAIKNYLKWTSKFIDACYTKWKRIEGEWIYVQVTELQERGHPHSHILTTFTPGDLVWGTKRTLGMHEGKYGWYDKPCWRSAWMAKQVIKSGLGKEYDISIVDKVEGASRYVAKYLFHPEMFLYRFPKHWKRVRYSQSFPKLKREKGSAVILITKDDWEWLTDYAEEIEVRSVDELLAVREKVKGRLPADCYTVREPETRDKDELIEDAMFKKIVSRIEMESSFEGDEKKS